MDFDAHYDKIYRYCFFLTGNRVQAEDITQEAFLRFISTDRGIRGSETAYLYRIARNLCMDAFRRNGRELLREPGAAEWDTDATSTHMEDQIVLRTDLNDALSEMTKEEQELLLLKYVNEEPDRLICGLYGISRFALYRRLNRLKAQLRKKLRDHDIHGYEEGEI